MTGDCDDGSSSTCLVISSLKLGANLNTMGNSVRNIYWIVAHLLSGVLGELGLSNYDPLGFPRGQSAFARLRLPVRMEPVLNELPNVSHKDMSSLSISKGHHEGCTFLRRSADYSGSLLRRT